MNTQAKKVPGSRSPNDIDRAVGARIRRLRLEADMTLHDLADQIGISHQQLQKYETGVNRVSAGMLQVVAEALGVLITDFFEDAEAPADKASKADRLRDDCAALLRKTKSEDVLLSMLKVLKALGSQRKP